MLICYEYCYGSGENLSKCVGLCSVLMKKNNFSQYKLLFNYNSTIKKMGCLSPFAFSYLTHPFFESQVECSFLLQKSLTFVPSQCWLLCAFFIACPHPAQHFSTTVCSFSRHRCSMTRGAKFVSLLMSTLFDLQCHLCVIKLTTENPSLHSFRSTGQLERIKYDVL